MKKLILVIGLASLTGCAGTVYRTNLEVYCPSISDYSSEYNERLAAEIEQLPETSSAIETAIKDYAALRDKVRACETEKENL